MAYEYEVRSVSRALKSAISDSRFRKNNCFSSVNETRFWWKGEAGNEFRNYYLGMNSELDKILTHINNAVNGIDLLPNLIKRAERERQEKANKSK